MRISGKYFMNLRRLLDGSRRLRVANLKLPVVRSIAMSEPVSATQGEGQQRKEKKEKNDGEWIE